MIIRLPFNLPGLNGIALIFFALVSRDAPETTPDHELIHLKQWWECGVIGFLPIYLIEYFAGRCQGMTHDQAYRDICFERDAFHWQGRSHERPAYDWVED